MTGLIHIYHGDGKGKTTAAIGSAVRAAGRGKKVLIARFLKTDDSGEVMGLGHVPGITLLPCDENFGFSWEMSDVQRKAASLYYNNLFRMAWEMAAGQDGADGFDMLVLDEVIGACGLGFVREDVVVEMLRGKPGGLEVIMTGRGPSDELMECADYITEMVMRRHPFEKGISAREGIEY